MCKSEVTPTPSPSGSWPSHRASQVGPSCLPRPSGDTHWVWLLFVSLSHSPTLPLSQSFLVHPLYLSMFFSTLFFSRGHSFFTPSPPPSFLALFLSVWRCLSVSLPMASSVTLQARDEHRLREGQTASPRGTDRHTEGQTGFHAGWPLHLLIPSPVSWR